MNELQHYKPLDQQDFDVLADSFVMAAISPVLKLVKPFIDALFLPVPEALVKSIATQTAKNVLEADPGTVRRIARNVKSSGFTKGTSPHKSLVDTVGFDPIPEKVYLGFAHFVSVLEEDILIGDNA